MSKRERILLRVERGALVPADAHSQQRLREKGYRVGDILAAERRVICAHCRRPLRRPAAMVGKLAFGPVCARRLGLLAPPSVRHAVCDVRYRVERDERTPDLFARIAA